MYEHVSSLLRPTDVRSTLKRCGTADRVSAGPMPCDRKQIGESVNLIVELICSSDVALRRLSAQEATEDLSFPPKIVHGTPLLAWA